MQHVEICAKITRTVKLSGLESWIQVKTEDVYVVLALFILKSNGGDLWRKPTKHFRTPYAFEKKTPNFAQGLDFSRIWARFETPDMPRWLYMHTVFHEESESEVEKCQILEPGGKM